MRGKHGILSQTKGNTIFKLQLILNLLSVTLGNKGSPIKLTMSIQQWVTQSSTKYFWKNFPPFNILGKTITHIIAHFNSKWCKPILILAGPSKTLRLVNWIKLFSKIGPKSDNFWWIILCQCIPPRLVKCQTHYQTMFNL